MNTATTSPLQVEADAANAEEHALLERILASRHFAKSGLLLRFLRYICERYLSGEGNCLTEQHIGVHVFGRPAGYDCGSDNIVRNYARQLRNRLDDYYRWEGLGETLRLEVPRGGYKPLFVPVIVERPIAAESYVATLAPLPLVTPATVHVQRGGVPRRALLALSVVTLLLLGAVLTLLKTRPRPTPVVVPPMHSFWSTVFRSDRDTVIVDADSGFGTLQDVLGRRLSLADYTSLRLGTLSLGSASRYVSNDLASQRYTSMTDLETAVALSHLPEVVPDRLSIRFARDLRMEDLKDNNVILVGSDYTNPWAELFEKNLNFELQGDVAAHTWRVLNRNPAPGEAKFYQGERDRASHETYARIAWVPNIDHNGHILMLQGLDMAGTQAAAQSLLHSATLLDIWQQADACHSSDASFEVLLGTTSIGSNAGTIRVLATRHSC